jgi:hypothetical protein
MRWPLSGEADQVGVHHLQNRCAVHALTIRNTAVQPPDDADRDRPGDGKELSEVFAQQRPTCRELGQHDVRRLRRMSGQSNVIDNTVAAIMKATVEAMNSAPVTRAILCRDPETISAVVRSVIPLPGC